MTILFPNPTFADHVIQSVPVAEFQNGILSLKKRPLAWETLESKRIAIIRGTEFSYGQRFATLSKSNVFDLVPVAESDQTVKMLVQGRVDGSAGPIVALRYWLEKAGYDWRSLIADPLVIESRTAYLMVSVAPDIDAGKRSAMLNKMGAVMQTLRDEGFVQAQLNSYMNY